MHIYIYMSQINVQTMGIFWQKKNKENKVNTIYKYTHQKTMDNWVNKL